MVREDDRLAVTTISYLCILFNLGLVSGYIPSPLYPRNTRWPRAYAIFQVVMLLLTFSRLTNPLPTTQNQDLWLEDFAEISQFLGTNLRVVFYDWELFLRGGLARIMDELVFFAGVFVLAKFLAKYEDKSSETKRIWIGYVILRNLLFITMTNYADFYDDMKDDFEHLVYCQEINPHRDLFPSEGIQSGIVSFLEAWKRFHPSHLWSVRLGHAILYPAILMLLTRRRLSEFIIWSVCFEFDFFQLNAEMNHYASGPELADARLDYQGGPNSCYVGPYMINMVLGYPVNFLFLTTPLGDTNLTTG